MSNKTFVPSKVNLEKDKNYHWCTCGLSAKQPFCDGTHKNNTDKKSQSFQVAENKDYYLCTCKRTKNPPYCDGSHSK
jgi:CDGSH-type Zn-finger protein